MVADRYDDGSSDVPGGLAGQVGRVVVVGAGIAGLTVANALGHGGVECVVLEARDRVGGRLHTIDLAGTPVDLGGSWIHHPVGNPLRAFADQVGVRCRPADALSGLGGYDCAQGRPLTPAEVDASVALQFEEFPAAVEERLRPGLGPDASVAEAIDAFLAAADLGAVQARRARQSLRAVIEAEAADRPERQSLQWMWNELEYGGAYFGDMPAGGYRTLVDAMAAGVDVRQGCDVTEVVDTGDGVRVRTADGLVESGSHVVVTVPLGVLRRGAPRFSPPLPAERTAAMGRLGFGRMEKVVLLFDEPFWRARGLSHLMLFPRDPDQGTVWVFDHDAFGGAPALVCLVFHSAAGIVDGPVDDAVAWLLDLLDGALGGPHPAPTAVAVSGWGTDRCTGGAYAHIPPGATPADLDLLGEPVAGRILFAGEHTQSARVAYADGAMTSGIREAKRLLGRPDVRLAAPAPH